MNIGRTIRIVRSKKGIRQGKLAKMVGISQAYLSQIEGNKRTGTLQTMKDISKCLGMPFPLLSFMSLEESDIDVSKKNAFRVISPAICAMIQEVF